MTSFYKDRANWNAGFQGASEEEWLNNLLESKAMTTGAGAGSDCVVSTTGKSEPGTSAFLDRISKISEQTGGNCAGNVNAQMLNTLFSNYDSSESLFSTFSTGAVSGPEAGSVDGTPEFVTSRGGPGVSSSVATSLASSLNNSLVNSPVIKSELLTDVDTMFSLDCKQAMPAAKESKNNDDKPAASKKPKKKRAPRKRLTPRQKQAHNKIEKRYRININTKIANLQSIIPWVSNEQTAFKTGSAKKGTDSADEEEVPKLNKSMILEKAISYILHLQNNEESANRINNYLLLEVKQLNPSKNYDEIVAAMAAESAAAATATSESQSPCSVSSSSSSSPASNDGQLLLDEQEFLDLD